jgi:predicted TIM-barrel fold metal-dependent hydrolase
MKIDAHVHYSTEEGFLERLIAEEQRLGFDKICLNGADWLAHHDANSAVEQAMAAYPDIVVGFAYFRLGDWTSEQVRDIHQRGFKGLKFIRPPSRYDDRGFYPVYEAAEQCGLVCLFHTGIVARTPTDGEHDVDNDRHRPVYLDTIARAFPSLSIIGAHLGNPWYEEAGMACRWNPNLYFDLSGSSLKRMPPEYFQSILWWSQTGPYGDPEGRDPWDKIVFGSDISVDQIADVVADYQRTMDAIGVGQELQDAVFGGTMAVLLGLEG